MCQWGPFIKSESVKYTTLLVSYCCILGLLPNIVNVDVLGSLEITKIGHITG